MAQKNRKQQIRKELKKKDVIDVYETEDMLVCIFQIMVYI